jgi:glycosyltransferase involved in cell wall biosynthesis
VETLKINFVSYLNPYKYSGGGEMVNRRLIEKGIVRGHKFTFTSAKNRIIDYDKSADIDFLVDIFNYPETLKSRGAWIHLDSKLIEGIVSSRPFIHMTNAYADVCNLGYLPCSGRSVNPCAHKSQFKLKRNIAAKEFGRTCFATKTIVKESYQKSILNLYVSPLHREITNRVLNMDDTKKSIVVRPIIDLNAFCNKNVDRDIDYLFVGVLSEAKGFESLRKNFSDKEIFMVGDIHPKIKLDFGRHLGKLPYHEIPSIMNRAKNFVFLPRWPEPQGRVVVEAALSGCNLIVNENVGALSFPFDISNPENIRNAEELFWEELESRISC